MRILYTLPGGAGNGHITRSRVSIDYLLSRGHSVTVAGNDTAYAVVSGLYPDAVEISGWQLAISGGGVDILGTVAVNLWHAPGYVIRNLSASRDIDSRRPEAVVSDLEPFGSTYARDRGLPCISIDNHTAISRCAHPHDIEALDPLASFKIDALVNRMTPDCDHYIATSFFGPTVLPRCAGNTTIVPPILRSSVLQAMEHIMRSGINCRFAPILVYQTGGTAHDTRLPETLASFPGQSFVVYGGKKRGEPDEQRGNALLRGFDEATFTMDLAMAPAVVANGGYSLLSESVALGKPVLSVPLRNHPEQLINAAYIERLGFGERAETLDPGVLAGFLGRAPGYARELARHPRHDNNRKLFSELDRLFG